MLSYVLHFLDAAAARQVATAFTSRLPAGSPGAGPGALAGSFLAGMGYQRA